MRNGYNIGVVGATGLVGKTLRTVLETGSLPITTLHCFASERSAGKTVIFQGKEVTVQALTPQSFTATPLDIVFFVAGGTISQAYRELSQQHHRITIDNSSAFRRAIDVPLVVPDVNGAVLDENVRFIANPNCTTIQTVHALADIHQLFGLKRVDVATYQAVSGSGYAGVYDLEHNTKLNYPTYILGNCIPMIDKVLDTGFTYEEDKMMFEINKILGIQIPVVATCVRVPVKVGHSAVVTVETETDINLEQLIEAYQKNKRLVLSEQISFPTPLDVAGRDTVHIGRLRQDPFDANKLHLWVVADNLRIGAATNAYDIACQFVNIK